MSSSLFFGYPQLALIPDAGLLGLAAYCFATVAPLWMFAWLGPYIRRVCPEGFTLAEFIRHRFGWPVGILAAIIVSFVAGNVVRVSRSWIRLLYCSMSSSAASCSAS